MNGKFLETIKKYWMIIIFIGMLVAGNTANAIKVENLEKKVEKFEEVFISISKIQIDIAVINTQIINIYGKI